MERDEHVKSKIITVRAGRLRAIIFFLIFFVVISAGLGALLYFKWEGEEVQLPKPGDPSEPAAIIAAVGKLVVLPGDETPRFAVVSDPSALRSEEFFKHAEVGDKILIYPRTQKVILYSPSKNKIVDMITLSLCPLLDGTLINDAASNANTVR